MSSKHLRIVFGTFLLCVVLAGVGWLVQPKANSDAPGAHLLKIEYRGTRTGLDVDAQKAHVLVLRNGQIVLDTTSFKCFRPKTGCEDNVVSFEIYNPRNFLEAGSLKVVPSASPQVFVGQDMTWNVRFRKGDDLVVRATFKTKRGVVYEVPGFVEWPGEQGWSMDDARLRVVKFELHEAGGFNSSVESK